MTRTQLLQALVRERGYRTYLEIGVDSGKNLRAIPCARKYGVDPANCPGTTHQMRSDEFFAQHAAALGPFDLIFIDGLHHEHQVRKDIMNSLDHMAEDGCIVVHDCNPQTEGAQAVPRRQRVWNGDVWKAWVRLRAGASLPMLCLDTDYGLGVIDDLLPIPDLMQLPDVLDFAWLQSNREEALQLVSPLEGADLLGLSS